MDALVFAFGLVLDAILMFTGRAVVFGLSSGRWRGVNLAGDEARIYGRAGALSFVRDGQRVVTGLGLSAVGGLFYFFLLLVVAWVGILFSG
ncbi:hypothetical protein [Variovorax sp. HJSM1_2]|uniref:hypothetical protein n=1 Tax=Variovorax sp. HJSM1_2 TaxID=3366263 RepID=UPI003BC37D8A